MAFNLKRFVEKLRVSDGAWGTQLQAAGLPPGGAPELWNAEKPDAVEAVARSYVEAGSDCILTNSFTGNRFLLERHGAGDRAAELMSSAVAISRRAANEAVRVFASMGPTGKIVMMEEVPAAEIVAAYAELAAPAADAGADAVVLETFNELDELKLAHEGVRRGCDLPVICSMTMGNTPADLAAAAEEAGAAAIGANCGVGPGNYVRVAELLRAASELPVWIKPNAGMPRIGPGGQTVFRMGPEEFTGHVPDLAAAGARIIGGCCGTTPEHIRLVREAVDRLAP